MLDSTTRVAWRNLGRNLRRTLLTLTAIALAQTTVLLMDGLMNGMEVSTTETLTGPLVGHAQVHAPDWRHEQAPDLLIDDLEARLAAIRELPSVEMAVARIYAPALVARDVDGHAAIVIGVDVEGESATGGLLEGLASETRPSARSVLVGAHFARERGIGVGDELALLGQTADGAMANDLVTVVGILRTQVDLINRSGVIMPLEAAQEIFAMHDAAHEITMRGASLERAPELAAAVGALEGFGELEVLPWRELAPEVSAILDLMGVYGLVVLFIVFIAAAAGVANTMLMATYERRRELGMLLALGASPARLVRMILTEATILGLAGVTLGCVIGGLLVFWQGQRGVDLLSLGGEDSGGEMGAYGIDFAQAIFPYLDFTDYLPGFVGVMLVSILASLWPALHTARLEPVEAMRG